MSGKGGRDWAPALSVDIQPDQAVTPPSMSTMFRVRVKPGALKGHWVGGVLYTPGEFLPGLWHEVPQTPGDRLEKVATETAAKEAAMVRRAAEPEPAAAKMVTIDEPDELTQLSAPPKVDSTSPVPIETIIAALPKAPAPGMSVADLAVELGMTKGSIRTRLHRHAKTRNSGIENVGGSWRRV